MRRLLRQTPSHWKSEQGQAQDEKVIKCAVLPLAVDASSFTLNLLFAKVQSSLTLFMLLFQSDIEPLRSDEERPKYALALALASYMTCLSISICHWPTAKVSGNFRQRSIQSEGYSVAWPQNLFHHHCPRQVQNTPAS
eukprot:scaffold19313_cov75-Skeletonema_dohrnii-CCMP3373.AAC.2